VVEKIFTIIKEGEMIGADTGEPERSKMWTTRVELPPYAKVNWAKLHIKAHCEAKALGFISVGGRLMVYFNEVLVADYQQVPDCRNIDEYIDVTQYEIPKEASAEGAKATNFLLLKAKIHITSVVRFRFPIDLIVDYSGEEPTSTSEFVSESEVESYEGKLLQMITKPEGIALIVVFLVVLFVIIGVAVRRR